MGESYTRVHLDRALGSAEWCAQFPLAMVEHLTAVTSDHSSLVLKLDSIVRKREMRGAYVEAEVVA